MPADTVAEAQAEAEAAAPPFPPFPRRDERVFGPSDSAPELAPEEAEAGEAAASAACTRWTAGGKGRGRGGAGADAGAAGSTLEL